MEDLPANLIPQGDILVTIRAMTRVQSGDTDYSVSRAGVSSFPRMNGENFLIATPSGSFMQGFRFVEWLCYLALKWIDPYEVEIPRMHSSQPSHDPHPNGPDKPGKLNLGNHDATRQLKHHPVFSLVDSPHPLETSNVLRPLTPTQVQPTWFGGVLGNLFVSFRSITNLCALLPKLCFIASVSGKSKMASSPDLRSDP